MVKKGKSFNCSTTGKIQLPSLTKMPESVIINSKTKNRISTKDSIPEIEKHDIISALKTDLHAQSELKSKNIKSLENLDQKLESIENEIQAEIDKQEQQQDESILADDKKDELIKNIQFELDEISNIEQSIEKLDEEIDTMKTFKDIKGNAFEQYMTDYKNVLSIVAKSRKPQNTGKNRDSISQKGQTKKSRFYKNDRSNKLSTFYNDRYNK